MQDKRAALTKFRASVSDGSDEDCKATARSVTESKAAWLTACLNLEDPAAVIEYCWGLVCVARLVGASGCDVIMSAGCIPIIVECLRRWPDDGPSGVVSFSCGALNMLAHKGSASVRTAISTVPGIQATLVAAEESGQSDGWAAQALQRLGL